MSRVVCPGCEKPYFPAQAWMHRSCAVANRAVANAARVANGSRHGKYANPEKRREYMRQLMAAKRAAARQSKGASQ